MTTGKEVGDNIFMMGIDSKSYEELLEIAKRENKSVTEVAAEALRKHVADARGLRESRDKKLLMEG